MRTCIHTRLLSIATICLFLPAAAAAADVSGQWDIVFHTDGGDRPALLTLSVDGSAVSGTMSEASGTGSAEGVPVKGTFENGELVLAFPFYSAEGGFEAELKIRGTLQEDKITGEFQFGEFTGTVDAARK